MGRRMSTDPLPRRSSCPTCGQAVQVATSYEGTNHYVGIDAWDASTLRTERDAAIAAATMNLRQLVRRAFKLVGYACDVPQRELEAQQWLADAAKIVTEEPSGAF